MDKVVSDTSRAPLRGLAVGSAVVGAILAVCAVMWYRTPLANVLSEGAGISVSVAVALMLVDRVVKHERALRYAELTWVVSETALDLVEEAAEHIAAFASRAVVPQAGLKIYLRAGDPGDEPETDPEARFWRSRTESEARYHRERMCATAVSCGEHARDAVAPSQTTVRTLALISPLLARLESAADRLSGIGHESEDLPTFVHWLWRVADQRHSLTSALAAINERPDHPEVWRVLERTLHVSLGRAYAAGLVVAQSAMSQRTDVAGTSAANQFNRPTDG